MKPIYVETSTYIDFIIENNNKDSKIEVDDRVRISKYKFFLQMVIWQIGLKKLLQLKKLKTIYHRHI